ncbi:MAG: porin [Succinivibrio sp.]
MKKSLLALAVVAMATTASAATVYDKDGTSLKVGGRVRADLYNGNFSNTANEDANLKNSARFNMAGNSQVFDWLSAFAFTEWEMNNGNNGSEGTTTREQFVGADFGPAGKILLGKTYDSLRHALIATNVYDDFGAVAQPTYTNRRPGQIRYEYNDHGVFFQGTYQTAQDKLVFKSADKLVTNPNVDSGFSTALGYTFDNVVFGPISIRAGYSYLNGQDENDKALEYGNHYFKNYKASGVGFAWGNTSTGPYVGLTVNKAETNMNGIGDAESYIIKSKGAEFTLGYHFDNGFGGFISYEVQDVYHDNDKSYDKIIYRRVPVYVTYKMNPNFMVWTEAEFDADSSDTATKKAKFDKGTFLSLGAQYTF